jgi:hypothetical protein
MMSSHMLLTAHTLCYVVLQRCGFTQHIADGALWSYYNKGRRYYSKDLTSNTSSDADTASEQTETAAETLEYQ